MARKKTKDIAAIEVATPTRPAGLINDAPIAYPVAETAVTALQVYRNPDRRPSESGPWDAEADKIAWIDEASGLACIILRQTDGTLSGYAAVGPDHPVFGFEAEALPVDLATSVHGSITYARTCEDNRFERQAHGKPRQERYTVCHTTYVRTVQEYRTVQTTRNEFEHEDLWWFGFHTNGVGDLVPKPRLGSSPRKGAVYRDQSFVYANVIELARRLRGMTARNPDPSPAGSPCLPPPSGGGEVA